MYLERGNVAWTSGQLHYRGLQPCRADRHPNSISKVSFVGAVPLFLESESRSSRESSFASRVPTTFVDGVQAPSRMPVRVREPAIYPLPPGRTGYKFDAYRHAQVCLCWQIASSYELRGPTADDIAQYKPVRGAAGGTEIGNVLLSFTTPQGLCQVPKCHTPRLVGLVYSHRNQSRTTRGPQAQASKTELKQSGRHASFCATTLVDHRGASLSYFLLRRTPNADTSSKVRETTPCGLGSLITECSGP
jgi:hypothetical protein